MVKNLHKSSSSEPVRFGSGIIQVGVSLNSAFGLEIALGTCGVSFGVHYDLMYVFRLKRIGVVSVLDLGRFRDWSLVR